MKLYAIKGDLSTSKILAAAKLADQTLTLELLKPNFHIEKKFKEIFTIKSVPILEIAEGQTLMKANAIVRYLASVSSKKSQIYGSSELQQARVDALQDFLSMELEHAIDQVLGVVQGKICSNKKALDSAEATIQKCLKYLCEVLKSNGTKYLTGNEITVADVCTAVMLHPVYRFFVEEDYWTKNVPEIKKWIERCFAEECVRTTVGCIIKPCTKRIEIPASDEA